MDTEKTAIELNKLDILSATNLGLWAILLDQTNQHFEMFADENMLEIMGANASLSPEDCYAHWQSHIHPNYREYVSRGVSTMLSTGEVLQLQYIWSHPTFGDVKVRCVGIRDTDRDGKLLLKGYHRLISRLDQKPGIFQLHVSEADRSLELENLRIRDFYRASLSEAIAYAELDLDNEQIQNLGGIWQEDAARFGGKVENFLQFLLDSKQEPGTGDTGFLCTNTRQLRAMVETGTQTQRFIYKCRFPGTWRWVELVIHTFEERIFHNMYALFYLKDVDAQKKHEIAQQEAAETDPLTKVYNRKTFEREIQTFLCGSHTSGTGTLILFDIDNFKKINDEHGHLTGDAILKHFAGTLESVFYKNGIVGRFGGDEFLVFLRNERTPDAVNPYMDRLFSQLPEHAPVCVHCSAGLVAVHTEDFRYNDALRCADEALYQSKHLGKNQYTWVEPIP